MLALTLGGGGLALTAQAPLGLDIYMPVPEDNPMTRAKVTLGRALFFDARLSADRTVSCASCHDPARAFAGPGPITAGVFGRLGKRNAPALINRGYGAAFFWDGRAATLEEQVLGPIENAVELGSEIETVVERLRRVPSYARAFRDVFGRPPGRADLARALATYVRSIQSAGSPVDRYLAGDRRALSTVAQAGLRLFRGKANCTACHIGPMLTDERFHNTGVAFTAGAPTDPGRAAVTGRDADRGAFKTPTLRHVAETGPYMHDGSLPTLQSVVDFYDRGGQPNPWLDPEVRPLQLALSEKGALLAFLRALTGTIQESVRPPAAMPTKSSRPLHALYESTR